MEVDLERRATLPVPRDCPSAADGGRGCRGTTFNPVPEESVHTDYQEVCWSGCVTLACNGSRGKHLGHLPLRLQGVQLPTTAHPLNIVMHSGHTACWHRSGCRSAHSAWRWARCQGR